MVAAETPGNDSPTVPPDRRMRVPTVLQMEAVECGAAALAMVLAYFGRIVPLEELRVECGVSRDGSKALKVLRAAKKYGLEAKGFKYELADLYKLDYPVILYWNANHFLVLEGFKKGKVYLNDPSQGPRVVTLEELDQSFSGVVLTFKEGVDFVPGGAKRSMAAALRRRLSNSETELLYVLLCGLLLVAPGLLVPTFSRIFVDEFLVADRQYVIRPLLLGMAITGAVTMTLIWLQQYHLLRLETKLALVASSRFFDHVLRLPISYFAQRYAGEIGLRMMINDRVAQVVSGRLATTAIDCLMIVFYAGLMLRYDVLLTVIVVSLAAVNIVAVKVVARSRIDASRRLINDQGKLSGTAMNGIQMIETLKATGGETEFFGRWAGYQAKSLRSEQALQLRSDLVRIVPAVVNVLITAAVLLVGGLAVMDGRLTVGLLVAYQSLTGFLIRPLNNFVDFGSLLQELEADLNRLDDVQQHGQDRLFEREENQECEDLPPDQQLKLQGKVELRDVTFGYSPLDKPLIENLSLTIEPGQRVALVGGTGSGKSTVAKLVAGLYEPWSGKILFDDVFSEELPRQRLTNSIAMVDQEIFVFSGTLRENITLWDEEIPLSQVTAACREAAIDEVIETRDGGYQAAVSEGGANFSGGQRQRIEIARALVGDPTVLVLDEATSALDPSTEEVINDSLSQRGCTCIIIAHRLSTIRDCDQILVMQQGQIVQRGTHEDMKDEPGPYQRLISAN